MSKDRKQALNDRILKETFSHGTYTESTIVSGGVQYPEGIAVDGDGNLYFADSENNRVLKETPYGSGYIQSVVTTSTLNGPYGVAVDSSGNVYVADSDNYRVLKEDLTDPPSLTFANTLVGSTSSDSPQAVTVDNIGNAAFTFPIPLTGNNPSIAANFTLNDSGASACQQLSVNSFAPATLAAGASCQLPISFTPLSSGTITGSLVLTDNNLNAAAPGYTTQSIALSGAGTQVTPTITWTTPAAITYGTALSAVQLNASSTVAGTFAYSPAAGTVLGAGTQILTVTFTPTDTVDYATATATATLTVSQAAPVLSWVTPAAITYGAALSGTQLNATSTVAGTFVYSPVAGTVLGAGAQTITVTFAPTDAVDYTTATGSVVLTVNKATPTINWATPAAITYGTALSGTQLNATSTVAGTFVYSPAAGTVLGAGAQTLTATFTPTDAVDYTTAADTVVLPVSKATPTINWATPAAITYATALSATQLNATSTVAGTFVYSPAAGAVLGAGAHTLTATFTPTDAVDYTTAAGTVVLPVNKATPTINWATPPAITYGTALSATQLNASSSVAGTFAYSPVAGTVLAVGSHSLTATFTSTDSTDYTAATATVTLTVNPAPSFTVGVSPASLALVQGASGTSTVTVTPQNGFTGSVQLAAIGLPAGVTAAFATNPTTGKSVLTLTVSKTAAVGSSTITITGTSGNLSASTTLSLAVTSAFACHVTYSITSQWPRGFGAAIAINNTGTVAISNWTLTWAFANGQTITGIWNGAEKQTGANVTVTNLSYNGNIPSGGSYNGLGFNGAWNNKTNAVPTSFAVNGITCK